MVLEGTSNDEIKQFMFERYGDFIMPTDSCLTRWWCGSLRIDLGCGIMGVDQNGQADASSGTSHQTAMNRTITRRQPCQSEDIAEVERLLGDESRTRP